MSETVKIKTKFSKRCAIKDCYAKPRTGLSFHAFPKDKNLKLKWVKLCKLSIKNVTPYTCICDDHFETENFHLMSMHGSKKHLKPNVVPSRNLPKAFFLPTKDMNKINCNLKRADRLKKRQELANSYNNKNIISNNSSTIIDKISTMENIIETPIIANSATQDVFDQNINPENHDEPSCCEHCEPSSFEERTKETIAVLALMELINLKTNPDPELKPHVILKCGEQICDSSLTDKRITLVDMLKSDEELSAFTGTTVQIFKNLVRVFCEFQDNKIKKNVAEARVMMCLCKLRLNLNFLCLGVLFNFKQSTCMNYFYSTLSILAEILSEAVYWPTKKEILCNMPKCFINFKNTVAVLDCTEVPIQVPSCLTCRIRLYSHYKGTHTVKVLISVSPSGQIIGVSAAFGGRASDKAIFNHSDMVENFTPGMDAVMTDKGFDIEHECLENNIKLWRPPKLQQKQFTHADYPMTKTIASARVHVERSIQRVKIFKIFQSRIQWNLMPYLDDIFTVICGLVNLSPPILSDEAFIKVT